MLRLVPLVAAFCIIGHPAAADESIKSQAGPLTVEVADDLALKDGARKKDLPYKVHYPGTGGPYPVVLFSHGYGGTKDAFGPIGQHWASHGYVVIHPTHADGLGRRRADPPQGGGGDPTARPRPGGLIGGLNDPHKIADRVADLVLILDNVGELENAVPGLKGKIDASRIGVGGHSFGAYTAMLIGGVTVDLGGVNGRSFADKRVRCILPISGQGTGQQGLTDTSWAMLKLPMMTITGTRDQGIGGQGVEWKKEPYTFSPPGDKYLVVIDGANHLSFGGGLGGRGSGITDIVKLFTVHFWDAYLKNSEPDRRRLRSGELVRAAGGACVVEAK